MRPRRRRPRGMRPQGPPATGAAPEAMPYDAPASPYGGGSSADYSPPPPSYGSEPPGGEPPAISPTSGPAMTRAAAGIPTARRAWATTNAMKGRVADADVVRALADPKE
jgi:hypothetical protein